MWIMELELRRKLLKLYFDASSGHIGCSLSCLDILYSIFKHRKSNESVILSKGHAAGALYIVLNHFGEISDKELSTFYKEGTRLSAHPSANSFESIPFALGSLGHGLPISAGIAKGHQMASRSDLVYVLMSDGETNEGTTWEAAHFAVANNLDNLVVFIDRNRLQGFGNTKDILGDSADPNKWISLGFEVHQIDGHNLDHIALTIQYCQQHRNQKPRVIIADTIKGKGVDFMENKMEWHYLPMTDSLYEQALLSLESSYYA
jgi:transketolase